ncbi:ParA family protein [Spirulina subsalsa FACHB-351]|uniref:ParA family protein n=1 Tax=Spirulina subsalsa FACHB-351 TaxID=234711 RepID=A0ABT3L2E6_9CYAN|nr:ParA family protein [Spirulina subsalsa]MCW6035688.1 ParA family protein [Spirulina subsalsa FACHB-351]
MGYIVSVVNMKGGVGKTTVTVNLGTCIARDFKKRVLIVDLDTQINATLSLMAPLYFATLKKERRTLRTLINQTIQTEEHPPITIQQVIYPDICQVKGLDILAGDVELCDDFLLSALIHNKSQFHQQTFEKTWSNVEFNLIRSILKPIIKQYDFILLDFPPADNLITRSALLASHFYIVPAKAEPLSVVGIGLLHSRIKHLQQENRSKIKLVGIIYTARGPVTTMEQKVKKRLGQEFGEDKIFQVEIPLNVAVAQAVDDFQPVVINNPKASGAIAYKRFAREFLQKLSKTLKS